MRRPENRKHLLATVLFMTCGGLVGCSSDVQMTMGRRNYPPPSVTGSPTSWRSSDPTSAAAYVARGAPVYMLPATGYAAPPTPLASPARPATPAPEEQVASAAAPYSTTEESGPAPQPYPHRPLVWIVPDPTDPNVLTASAQLPVVSTATPPPAGPQPGATGDPKPLKLAVLEEGGALDSKQAHTEGAGVPPLFPEPVTASAPTQAPRSQPAAVPALAAPAKTQVPAPVAPPLDAAPVQPPLAAAPAVPPTQVSKDAAPPMMSRPPLPLYRLVHSKRITLNYDVENIGPSGVARIELWYTKDHRTWQKHPATPQAGFPFVVEVEGEGLYGFTLVARNGLNQGQGPPSPGEVPQVLVEVDLTPPTIKLNGTRLGSLEGAPALRIDWQASDKSLGSTPIRICFATQANGPWQPMVTDLENWGTYLWKLPTGLPPQFFLRVEATDRAGNTSSDQTHDPVVIECSQPRVSVRSVD